MKSDPSKLLQLCGSLFDESTAYLQKKVTQYLEEETGAQTAFLLFVSDDQDELCCKVVGRKILEESVKFPIQSNSFSTAITEKRPLTLEDIKNEQSEIISSMMDDPLLTLLCVPVIHPHNEDKVSILACLVNKENFDEEDTDIVVECFTYIAPILIKSLAFEEEKRLRKQCQSLLTVAKNLFTHLDDVTLLLREIMTEARNLTKAERCSLFLLDKEQNELVAKVFDGSATEDGIDHSFEVRIPSNEGIAGYVATSGEVLNIHDAYAHPLFYRKMDETTGFKTRNILCFPIKDDSGVIGVAELCNKINARYFSSFDEEIAKAFSIYCGISIMHSLMWKKVRDSQHRSHLSNELMMYHMQVPIDEVMKFAHNPILSPSYFGEDFDKFHFLPRSITENETHLAVMTMFDDVGFISRWRIPMEHLSKFILMVRKGYRDPPYHNWMHAFSVAHFCYLLFKNFNIMEQYLTDLECFSLFVACLCHDLDHRGTNNSFQVTSKSDLAALYSSEGSVMERHHFAQAMAILNTEGCNIFETFSKKEYIQCLDCIRDIILATDLAHHIRIIEDIKKVQQEGFDKENYHHHQLLLCLLVTCSDLSDQTKDWKSSKKIAELVYSEFFSQGDLEKAMGVHPSEMMDREKACIPELQISFITTIVLPLYELLAAFFPEAEEISNAVNTNKVYWERMRDIYKRRYSNSSSSLDMFEDETLEQEVLNGFQDATEGNTEETEDAEDAL